MRVSQLTGTVHDVQVEYVRTSVLAGAPEGRTTLVDTGFDRTATELVETLEAEFGDVDWVILTHDGGDHCGGLDAVVETFDPELYAPAGETALSDAINYDPDVTYEGGDVLPGGIEVIQIPGHTPSTSALLVREENTLISGDTLDGADRRGLLEGYLLPPPAVFNTTMPTRRASRNCSTTSSTPSTRFTGVTFTRMRRRN